MEFISGDAFLFCSDGLTTMLSDEEIRDTVAADETKDAQAMCQGLVDLANEKGGVDNITVVFVRITDTAEPETAKPETAEAATAKHAAAKPATAKPAK